MKPLSHIFIKAVSLEKTAELGELKIFHLPLKKRCGIVGRATKGIREGGRRESSRPSRRYVGSRRRPCAGLDGFRSLNRGCVRNRARRPASGGYHGSAARRLGSSFTRRARRWGQRRLPGEAARRWGFVCARSTGAGPAPASMLRRLPRNGHLTLLTCYHRLFLR